MSKRMVCTKDEWILWNGLALLVTVVNLASCQHVERKFWHTIKTKSNTNLGQTGSIFQGKPFTSMALQLSDNMSPPALDATPLPRSLECKAASDCLGVSGCCLRGLCSKTGGAFDSCYTQELMNGQTRYQGVWRKSDLCPCAYSYHCLAINSGDSHPQHGPRGFCIPAIG
ncbi:hypothetical protein RRG08_024371 [Elysia crispata]|uniref:Uncharacterized protein n=1 Tax=Elysia crispata TaxID=231223 RepID=A0AAE0ZLD4_9GAST|nr:hypothetical protein RRG08_024371 [Elysia crispata]